MACLGLSLDLDWVWVGFGLGWGWGGYGARMRRGWHHWRGRELGCVRRHILGMCIDSGMCGARFDNVPVSAEAAAWLRGSAPTLMRVFLVFGVLRVLYHSPTCRTSSPPVLCCMRRLR